MSKRFKLFLASGLPFGLIMGILLGFSGEFTFSTGFLIGMIAGLIGGLLFSFALGNLDTYSKSSLSISESDEAMGVHQVRSIILNLPYNKTFNLCLSSIKVVSGKIKNQDYSSGKIYARSGLAWKGWGDRISYDIQKLNNNKTLIKVESKPILPTMMVDYGQNWENVEKISHFLNGCDKAESNNKK